MEAKPYSGCVMLDLYNPLWRQYIDKQKSYHGVLEEFEETPHVTILYGLDNSVVYDAHNMIVDYISQNQYYSTILSEKTPSIFINDRVVSKFNVIGGNIDLAKMNLMLKANFDYQSKYNGYSPHITICYSNMFKVFETIAYNKFIVSGVHSSISMVDGSFCTINKYSINI